MWQIHLIKNEPEISVACAKEIRRATKAEYSNTIVDNKLNFDSDNYEHMDFCQNEKIQKILKKHKIKGDICFLDAEGSSELQMWGYRFDGNGNMEHLSGNITWQTCK